METPSVLVAVRVPRELHTQIEDAIQRNNAAGKRRPSTWTGIILVAVEHWLNECQRRDDYLSRKRAERRKVREMLPLADQIRTVEG
jgi:hypothetical protein